MSFENKEIPKGATHEDYMGGFFKLENGVWYMWRYFSQKWLEFDSGDWSYKNGYLHKIK